MQTQNEDYLYPAASMCWCCGLPVESDRTTGYRFCARCDVRWVERLANVQPVAWMPPEHPGTSHP